MQRGYINHYPMNNVTLILHNFNIVNIYAGS